MIIRYSDPKGNFHKYDYGLGFRAWTLQCSTFLNMTGLL